MMSNDAIATNVIEDASESRNKPHVCPWWLGYLLVNPLRKWLEDPDKLLRPHVQPGMRVVDFGAAMGFFSLPLARIVGEDGHVVCVDVQARMLAGLRRRAAKANLSQRIETVLCRPEDLGLANRASSFDLIIAMYVMHEVPNPSQTFAQLAALLKPDGRMLFMEPKGHVSARDFEEELAHAQRAGLRAIERSPWRRGHAALLEKSAGVSSC